MSNLLMFCTVKKEECEGKEEGGEGYGQPEAGAGAR